jgi:hypothetical protein
MSLPNIEKHIIATGASVVLRVSTNSLKPSTILGLVSNVSYQENFSLGRANVIGLLGPVSIDPQDYNLSITIGTLVPAKLKIGADGYDNITKGVLEMLPKRSSIFSTKSGKVFQSMDFYDKDSKEVLACFIGCVLESNGMQIEGSQYARANVQFQAIDRTV